MDEIDERVSNVLLRIKDERQKQNLSQVQLAAKADIAQSYYSGIETLQNVPTLTTVFKLADALDLPVIKLFEEIDYDREKVKELIIKQIKENL